jgi:hypothetical protein
MTSSMIHWRRFLVLGLALASFSSFAAKPGPKTPEKPEKCDDEIASKSPKVTPVLAQLMKDLNAADMGSHPITVVLWLRQAAGYPPEKMEAMVKKDNARLFEIYGRALRSQYSNLIDQVGLDRGRLLPGIHGVSIQISLTQAEIALAAANPQVNRIYLSDLTTGAPKKEELAMAPGVLEAFLTGQSSVSVRKGRRDYYKVRPATMVATDSEVRIHVNFEKVAFKKFKKLTRKELEGEGPGVTRESLLAALQSFYPDLTEESEVTVVTFSP